MTREHKILKNQDGMERMVRVKEKAKNVLNVINNMKSSTDLNYISETVKISKNLSIQLECMRADDDSAHPVLIFEIMAINNGNLVDCCIENQFQRIPESVEYLINCYI